METHYQQSLIIERFHQLELLLECQAGRVAYHSPLLGVESQLTRHETTGIKDQIRPLQETLATHGDQLRISRPRTDDLDMSLALRYPVDGESECEMGALLQATFLFLDQQVAPFSRSQATSLSHTVKPGRSESLLRRIGNLDPLQILLLIDDPFRSRMTSQQISKQQLLLLQLDSQDPTNRKRRQTTTKQRTIDLLGDALRIASLPATDSQIQDRRSIIKCRDS